MTRSLPLLVALAALLPGCAEVPCEGAGVVCRVAGTGALAFNGDGLPAAQTDFYLVSAVREGPDRRVYVMDFNNHRLRAIDAEGRVTTVVGNGEHAVAFAGMPAVESPMENPIDFAFGPDGRLILVPLHDPRVLRVRHDGILEVVAGTGEAADDGDGADARLARFHELAGVAVAPDGRIFVSDWVAHRVRVIHPGGVITAYAGTGEAGYDGDGGPATQARLNRPEGLALDGAGNLYIAESGNHVIRRVSPDGRISTFAGTGRRGFSGEGGPCDAADLDSPEGVAAGPGGVVYLSDSRNGRIRRVDPDGTIHTLAGTGEPGLAGDGGPAAAAHLHGPSRLSLDGSDLYFADLRNSVARVIHLE